MKLDELIELSKRATPGPWEVTQYDVHGPYSLWHPTVDGAGEYVGNSREDAVFIVAACNAFPAIAEMVQIAMRLVPAPEDIGGHDDPTAPESIQAIVADAKRFKELADLLGRGSRWETNHTTTNLTTPTITTR